MRLGITFAELQTDLRAEIGRSTDLSVGVDDVARLKRALNSAYTTLADENDWPHLRTVFARVSTVAGERYIDPPDGLAIDRIECVDVWWNASPSPLTRGIGAAEHASFDSHAGERSDPVLRWDVRYVEEQNATMIELWPLPASDQCEIEFTGIRECKQFVNDADRCWLDAEAVILFAAADMLDEDAGRKKLAKAQARLSRIKARGASDAPMRMGLGRTASDIPAGRAVVRIRG